jgi:hypothetical protein
MLTPMHTPTPPLVVKAELESLRHLLAILADPDKTKRRVEELTAAAEKLKRHQDQHADDAAKFAGLRVEHELKLRDAKALHDKVLAEDREAFARECHARLEQIKREEARLEQMKQDWDAHLQNMSLMTRGRAAVA